MKKLVTLAVAAGLVFGTAACSADGFTDQSMQTLRYEKGDTQGGAFHSCVNPGEKIVTNDALYPYPKTQREAVWDSDHFEQGNKSADYPDLRVVDKDGNTAYVKMKLQFFLNTDCEPVEVSGKEYEGGTLQVFHEFFGKTRKAYFNEDGGYGDGWLWAMTNYLGTPAVKRARAAAQRYSVEDLWLEPANLDKFAADVLGEDGSAYQAVVDSGMQTDLQFYNNFSLTVYSVAPDEGFEKLYKERKEADVRAETAELNKAALITEAEAEAEVLEKKMKPYGSPENYLKAECMRVNPECNPFQPTLPGYGARE